MGIGRRRVGLQEQERWVYNRMVDAYAARPQYPRALVSRLAELAGTPPAAVVDIGAGIGHLSLPLAARGYAVSAVEPAAAMLEALRERARARKLSLRALHATAEALPLADASVELALICDALHFLDAHLAGRELARVLRPGGALALVQVELGDAPFMQALRALLEEAAPRRPKRVTATLTQLTALAGVKLERLDSYEHELGLDIAQIERILGSISFIGPAMNPARFSHLCARLRAIEHAPLWQTRLRLWAGRRSAR